MQSYINIKSIHLTLCQLVSKTSPLVGFKSKAYDWLVLNSKQEGVRFVGFKYQKADEWLDSKFHCSYLESRGVPERRTAGNTGKSAGNYLTSISGSRLSVMQLPVTSLLLQKCGFKYAHILLPTLLI
jgi:hypothetical protein